MNETSVFSTMFDQSAYYQLQPQSNRTRSSSEDEIANVNFFYDDIVHVLQNAIDSRINFAKDVTYHRVYCKPEGKHHINQIEQR